MRVSGKEALARRPGAASAAAPPLRLQMRTSYLPAVLRPSGLHGACPSARRGPSPTSDESAVAGVERGIDRLRVRAATLGLACARALDQPTGRVCRGAGGDAAQMLLGDNGVLMLAEHVLHALQRVEVRGHPLLCRQPV